MITAIIIISSFIAIGILIKIVLDKSKKNKELKNIIDEYTEKYKGIIDVDKEIAEKINTFNIEKEESEKRIVELKREFTDLKEKYLSAEKLYQELKKDNELLKDTLEIAEYGFYEPHFDLDTSEDYKDSIKENKEKQKDLIYLGKAVVCKTNWTVGNSQKQGEVMTKRAIKLTLRAFNGECDTLIAKVKWNNVEQYEKRIRKVFEAINKLNVSQDIHIQASFLSLKIDELMLTYGYALKKQEEKDEQKRIREQIREEEKARRDFEKAQKEAIKEEKMLQQAMEKARNEILKSSEEDKLKYEEQLKELQIKLQEAEDKNKRALSMAQQTKSGHVYVISNIGSFGENVYKIGMTRRLEPMDRVNELGDASVPFKFDVHAMIYSENAPELENKLHKVFNNKRLNHVNLRREYFNISLDEIEKVVRENYGKIEFIKNAEAKEYRESLVIKKQITAKLNKKENKESHETAMKQEIDALFESI